MSASLKGVKGGTPPPRAGDRLRCPSGRGPTATAAFCRLALHREGVGGRAHGTRGGHTRLRSQDRDGVPRSPRRRGPKAEAFFSARSEPRPSPQGEQLSKLYELKHVRAERIEESPAQRGRQTPQMKSEAAEPGSVKC